MSTATSTVPIFSALFRPRNVTRLRISRNNRLESRSIADSSSLVHYLLPNSLPDHHDKVID
ncbi:hypothetical protein CVT25_002417 [Psilocybe cyanescens]|uniref:Uncharacterized protein n=1 Tax=Psilocybe cyanescens TaxID=93625 RepID=A0A409XR20_PSICY|nr:hypothetical protein CVT25_002417 [Psilocybe cyanescens]